VNRPKANPQILRFSQNVERKFEMGSAKILFAHRESLSLIGRGQGEGQDAGTPRERFN